MDRPDVAVVIVTYNSEQQVSELLRTLPAAMDGLRYTVVCVDNDSSDDTREVVGAWPGVEVVHRPNHGYAAGINAGADAAGDCEAILVLNPDVTLSAGCVRTMLSCLRETGAGIITPRILGGDGDLALTLRREPTLLRALGLSKTGLPVFSEHVQERSAYERRHEVAWATGAVMLVSRAAHDALGGWDESYFLYSEETDFCLRARDHGLVTVYEPAAVTTHVGGGSGRSPRTETMQALNRVRLYSRRHGSLAGTAYFLVILLSSLRHMAMGRADGRAAVRALLQPSDRPHELGLDRRLVPR